jgi:hypothetical protein
MLANPKKLLRLERAKGQFNPARQLAIDEGGTSQQTRPTVLAAGQT